MTLSLSPDTNPLALFTQWYDEAQAQEPNDPNAMALATVDSAGRISQRMVLLKDYDESGFCFYSNGNSLKGQALRENPRASLLFHWKSSRRQVRIEGGVTPVSDAVADAYFASRPRGSQIGAWASAQSDVLESREYLLERIAELETQYPEDVPRPPYWSGYGVAAAYMEFWQDGADRLHDRFAFSQSASGAWQMARLYP